ncbi:hypothetical protein [Bacillus thermotolerans]|uniref:Uncharacterized protein n=1 Tax=Bacillus thermotolerans TaxID=1221996 RepID=A0A0F5HN74_BACTR|nr:hypothetical protein [Bacillus thermotolerans]KKB34751.1 hypothetical protein QY97_02164 [Bacillus thermotolerans]KKB36311.1 hypothetical protein QY95_03175 [Bacillus thermotolerans]
MVAAPDRGKKEREAPFIALFQSVFSYKEALVLLWEQTHERRINDRLLVHLIRRNLNELSHYLHVFIRRYEVYAQYHEHLSISQELLYRIERYLTSIDRLSDRLQASFYERKKISSLIEHLLHEWRVFMKLQEKRPYRNNPNTRWIASCIADPIKKGGNR